MNKNDDCKCEVSIEEDGIMLLARERISGNSSVLKTNQIFISNEDLIKVHCKIKREIICNKSGVGKEIMSIMDQNKGKPIKVLINSPWYTRPTIIGCIDNNGDYYDIEELFRVVAQIPQRFIIKHTDVTPDEVIVCLMHELRLKEANDGNSQTLQDKQ